MIPNDDWLRDEILAVLAAGWGAVSTAEAVLRRAAEHVGDTAAPVTDGRPPLEDVPLGDDVDEMIVLLQVLERQQARFLDLLCREE